MSLAWREIREHFMQTASTLSFQRRFAALGRSFEPIAAFLDPTALLDALHRGDESPARKNEILAALARAAQTEGPDGDCALALAALALWPGLDAAHGRLRRLYPRDPEGLVSDLSAEFVRQIRTLRFDRVRKIAATVVRNVERDVRRRRLGEVKRIGALAELDEDAVAAPEPPGAIALIADAHDEAGLRRLEERVERLIGGDAALVIEIAVRGSPRNEASAAFGLNEETGRKRYQRAMAKLRRALAA